MSITTIVSATAPAISCSTTDEVKTAEINDNYGVRSEMLENVGFKKGAKAARYSKNIFMMSGKAINDLRAEMSRMVKNVSIDCGNLKCLSPAGKQSLDEYMRNAKVRYEALVETFLSDYSGNIERDRELLGSAFDFSDYPSYGKMAKKLAFEYSTQEVNEREINGVKISANDSFQAAVYNELCDAIQHCVDAMQPGKRIVDGEKKHGPFSKLKDFCARIPDLNVNNDTALNDKAQTLVLMLEYVTPDVLRANPSIKETTERVLNEAKNEFTKRSII